MNTCDHYDNVKTKASVESLKSVCNHVLATLTTYMETRGFNDALTLRRMTSKSYQNNQKWSILSKYGGHLLFCNNSYETAQEHLPCKLPLASLKQIEKFLHFSLKTVAKYL